MDTVAVAAIVASGDDARGGGKKVEVVVEVRASEGRDQGMTGLLKNREQRP